MRKRLFSLALLVACQHAACTSANSGTGPSAITAGGNAGTVTGGGTSVAANGGAGTASGTGGTQSGAGGTAASATGGTPSTAGASAGGSVSMAGTSAGGEPPSTAGTASGGTGDTSAGTGAGGDPGVAGATAESGAGGSSAQAGSAGSGGTEPCVVNHGSEIPALKDYYADHFAMGAAIDSGYSSRSALITKHYNSITAENEMKFDSLQPSQGNFSYGAADQMVNFAQTNGMQVRGHALVWHRQTPAWVFNGSAAQVLQRMKDHITAVMQHFQGKVQIWDVVNEAIMDDGTYRTNDEVDGQQSPWYGALGESYIAEAFIAARAADPDAKLFYNDYYNYHPVRRQAIYDMLEGLLADGVPVDGVGLQGHLNLEPGTNPDEQSYHQTVENMETAIEMYSSLGLDVQVTEMDISLYLRGIMYTEDMFYTPATVTAEIQEQQGERYRAFFDMFRQHSNVIGSVTTWGITDDNTWLSEFDSGRQDFPLLFDAQGEPKPAFWAVVDFCQ